jgi:hypothetical protein
MRLSYIIQNNDRDFFEKNNHFFLMKHMGSHVLEKRKITAKPVVLRCRCCTFNYIMSEKYSRSQILSYLRQIKLPRFIVTSAWRVGGGGGSSQNFIRLQTERKAGEVVLMVWETLEGAADNNGGVEALALRCAQSMRACGQWRG